MWDKSYYGLILLGHASLIGIAASMLWDGIVGGTLYLLLHCGIMAGIRDE